MLPQAPDAKRKAQVDLALPVPPADPSAAAAPPIAQSFGIEAQVASQLRATGRRSLSLEVPGDGQAFHFRKLKDHAVLELTLKEPWTPAQKIQAAVLGLGLLVWLVLSACAARRENRAASR